MHKEYMSPLLSKYYYNNMANGCRVMIKFRIVKYNSLYYCHSYYRQEWRQEH
jgi:hypothetical protein